ncbi:MAG: hypothetical protein ACK557_05650, partial [Planctomycetota bacterium]
SKQALARLAQPEIVAFYDAYKKTSVAPMGELPKRPDITFPEPPAETGATGNAPAAEAAAAPAAVAPAAVTPAAVTPAAAPAEASTPAVEENVKKDGGE